MSVPALRRIVVGVDGSAESAAAFRWACREASLRDAEIHAVHVREANCHSLASYAVPEADSQESPHDYDEVDPVEPLRSLVPDQSAGADVQVRTEVVDGLAARVLLDRCAGADMLVLGTASDTTGAPRSAGPVIRACLRRAACPVVVISVAQDPFPHRAAAVAAEKVPAGAGVLPRQPGNVKRRGVRVAIRVKPGSARTAVGGRHGDALVVAVSARAVDGKATEAALRAVADAFAVRRRDVTLVTGATNRDKVVDIPGETAALSVRRDRLLDHLDLPAG